MADILDISKLQACDIHLESDLCHIIEYCFAQSFPSKLQETIALHVLRVLRVLRKPVREALSPCRALRGCKAR